MKAKKSAPRRRGRRALVIQKPAGVVQERVEQVGPNHFGVVSVDCAKARSKWMLCDFFGNILIEPRVVEHCQADLEAALALLRQTCGARDILDLFVAVERTGRHHHHAKRAFAAAGYEVRIVHPFATKQFRLPSDPGNKTDDTDLVAIHRAAVNGFALRTQELDDLHQRLQMLVRHRRDLVGKRAQLRTQIREHLDLILPGYARCFSDLWESPVAFPLALAFPSAPHMLAADFQGLSACLRAAQVKFQRQTLRNILAWAAAAAPPDPCPTMHHRIVAALREDFEHKTRQIRACERDSAALLAQTPYILLLSFPGINVVSAAGFAGEMGPINHYANPKKITGRAGLYPSRYQSDGVDRSDGPLVRHANRRLRAAILLIAENLATCNHHFHALAARWRSLGTSAGRARVKLACRFCRIAFHMVAGRQVFRHPSMQPRHYILDKLMRFHKEHDTPLEQTLVDYRAAIGIVPRQEHRAEAKPIQEELDKLNVARRGPQLLGDILAEVLTRLGVGAIECSESGEHDLH